MKSDHPSKLKTTLFSTCGLFRHCSAQATLSPTTLDPPLPLSNSISPAPSPAPAPSSSSLSPPPPPPLTQPKQSKSLDAPNPNKPESSSSSSSSSASTSQSFTQWRFPVPSSPLHRPSAPSNPGSAPILNPPFLPTTNNYQELFHVAELQLVSGSENDRRMALHLLERSVVANPPADPACPPGLMLAVVQSLRDSGTVKPATKILLALCLAEGNRRVAVEAGIVGAVVEAATEMEASSAERALAALELASTVEEGVAELRAHALAVPVMVTMMGKMTGRGKEYAISSLAVIYGCAEDTGLHPPSDEVARAVELAMQQGDCTERGKRKGGRLLLALRDLKAQASDQATLDLGDDGGHQVP